MGIAIDPDLPSSWPRRVHEWVERAAEGLEQVEHVGDLGSHLIEAEAEFRRLFASEKVLGYHCSRFLEWELEAVQRDGLRILTRELVEERLQQAVHHHALTQEQFNELRARHVFAVGDVSGRENQVCLAVGRAALDDSGCEWLLSLWGGEAIYWDVADEVGKRPVIGRPTVVVVQIPVAKTTDELFLAPCLAKLFVGTFLQIPGRFSDAFLRMPIPPEDVLDFWHPGRDEYDRHVGLPQT